MEYFASITSSLASLGRSVIEPVQQMGKIAIFFFRAFIHIFSFPQQLSKIIEHVYFIGAKSVFVVCLTGAFTGMVLGLQGYYNLSKFGSEGALGAVVALTLIREMGPVMSAIMIISRAGSAMSAEIGIMRISEQIDALFTMDINPVRFLVTPRLIAALISFPILTALFDVIGIFGGYLTGSLMLGINSAIYYSRVNSSVLMEDVSGGFIKSIFFALFVITICCFQGYYTHTRKDGFGAKGVGLATTSAVVTSCVMVLIVDYVLTSFLL